MRQQRGYSQFFVGEMLYVSFTRDITRTIIIFVMKSKHNKFSEILRHRQIVQHYPVEQSPSHHYPTLYPRQHPLFYEDQIFQELQRTSIVEDYKLGYQISDHQNSMDVESDVERMQEEEPYLQFFQHEKSHIRLQSSKMLDSASSGRQLPSRNSSVSSLSSRSENQSPNPILPRLQSGTFHDQLFAKPSKMDVEEGRRAKPRREVGSSTERRERLTKIKKLQQIGCNCKKSKCLKMYCECFNLQILCGQNCSCVDCGNMCENQSHQKAVLDALTRNPKAFVQDAQKMPTVFELGVQLSQVKKGCKCRKTQCKKKYCECFNSGQPCGIFCQCEGCANTAVPR